MTTSKIALVAVAAGAAFLTITLPGRAAPPTQQDMDWLAAAKEALPRLETLLASITTDCGDLKTIETTCLQTLDTSVATLYVIRHTMAEVTPPDCFRGSNDKVNAAVRSFSDAMPTMRIAISKNDRPALNAALQFMRDGGRYISEGTALARAEAPTCFK